MSPAVGVNLAGYLDAALGVGEVARRTRAALERAGVPVAARTLNAEGVARVPAAEAPWEPARHPLTLVCANAEGMQGARAELGDDWFDGRYAIGFWWWEAAVFPSRWEREFDALDEVWVGSHYVADALAPVSPVPVVRVPVPVTVAAPDAAARLELPQGRPLFLVVFDYGAVFERKNPLAAVEAFRRAFGEGDEAALVVKCVGSERHPGEHARLLEAAAGDDRIRVIDAVLAPGELSALLHACDAYVSLHRSEGFGMVIAEAMLLGKPAVATGYGGPADYLSERTGFPVDHELTAIGPGREPYPAHARWAEPSVQHAAALMRRVADEPDEAAARGARARERIESEHGLEAAGSAMAARLASVTGFGAAANGSHELTEELLRRIRSEPARPGRLGPARGLVRRAALRLGRPQAAHQRLVDEELARAIRTLDERVQGLAASNASVLAELRALQERLEQDDERSS